MTEAFLGLSAAERSEALQVAASTSGRPLHVQELGSRTRYTLSTNDETEGQFTLWLVSFVVAGGALIAIIFAVRRHYRCPKCGEVPMGTWVDSGPSSFGVNRGVDLFPANCPHCGARLR